MRSADHKAYLNKVYEQMVADLHYPQGKDGAQMDATAFKYLVAWHLVRCGWRKPNNLDHLPLVEEYDDPLIKKRKVTGPGVVEDAVTWVPLDAPDDPLAHLEDMTMREIEALDPDLQLEAKRRLGLEVPVEIPESAGWSVQPFITITDGEEAGDDTEWIPERNS